MLLVPQKTSFTPDHAECRYPYMFDPHEGEAEISVVFTWDKKKAEDMALAWRDWGLNVKVGGCAYDDAVVGDAYLTATDNILSWATYCWTDKPPPTPIWGDILA